MWSLASFEPFHPRVWYIRIPLSLSTYNSECGVVVCTVLYGARWAAVVIRWTAIRTRQLITSFTHVPNAKHADSWTWRLVSWSWGRIRSDPCILWPLHPPSPICIDSKSHSLNVCYGDAELGAYMGNSRKTNSSHHKCLRDDMETTP